MVGDLQKVTGGHACGQQILDPLLFHIPGEEEAVSLVGNIHQEGGVVVPILGVGPSAGAQDGEACRTQGQFQFVTDLRHRHAAFFQSLTVGHIGLRLRVFRGVVRLNDPVHRNGFQDLGCAAYMVLVEMRDDQGIQMIHILFLQRLQNSGGVFRFTGIDHVAGLSLLKEGAVRLADFQDVRCQGTPLLLGFAAGEQGEDQAGQQEPAGNAPSHF